jgi:hypothetical protein
MMPSEHDGTREIEDLQHMSSFSFHFCLLAKTMEEVKDGEDKTLDLGPMLLNKTLKYGGRESTPPAVSLAHSEFRVVVNERSN